MICTGAVYNGTPFLQLSERPSVNFVPLLLYTSSMYICTCIIVIFFFLLGTSLRARTFVPNVGWGGHTSTVGLMLPEVRARSVQCVARGKPFKLFWPWAHVKAYPRVSATSPGFRNIPGDWVSAYPIPVHACKIWMQTGFSAHRGDTHISLFLHRAPRDDPVYQQQSSPEAAAACNSMRVRLLLL